MLSLFSILIQSQYLLSQFGAFYPGLDLGKGDLAGGAAIIGKGAEAAVVGGA